MRSGNKLVICNDAAKFRGLIVGCNVIIMDGVKGQSYENKICCNKTELSFKLVPLMHTCWSQQISGTSWDPFQRCQPLSGNTSLARGMLLRRDFDSKANKANEVLLMCVFVGCSIKNILRLWGTICNMWMLIDRSFDSLLQSSVTWSTHLRHSSSPILRYFDVSVSNWHWDKLQIMQSQTSRWHWWNHVWTNIPL